MKRRVFSERGEEYFRWIRTRFECVKKRTKYNHSHVNVCAEMDFPYLSEFE